MSVDVFLDHCRSFPFHVPFLSRFVLDGTNSPDVVLDVGRNVTVTLCHVSAESRRWSGHERAGRLEPGRDGPRGGGHHSGRRPGEGPPRPPLQLCKSLSTSAGVGGDWALATAGVKLYNRSPLLSTSLCRGYGANNVGTTKLS